MSYRTTKEIASASGLSKRAIQLRVLLERWQFILIQDRGGQIPLFICRKLPEDIQKKLGLKQ